MEFKDSYECVGFNTIFIKEERISDEELNGFVKVEATDEAVDPLQLDTGCSSTIPPPPSLVELGGELRTCDGFTPTDKSSNSADLSVTKNSNVCEFCGESFYDEYTLRTHITEHNRDESNLCQICGEIFPNKSYYTAHFETCSSKSILFQRLTMRMNVEKPFKCESCFKVFSSKKYLSAHIKTHTKKRFICEFCNREFLKRRDFNNHIKTHKQNQEDFKCDFCNKCFESQSSFILHVRIHTNNVHLVCNFCNKTFLQKSHLSDHIIKTHKVSNKPTFFKCDFCKKFFSKEEGLKIHMAKVHNKDEGYKCEFECCNKILSNKESLKNHVAIHTKGDVIPSQTKLVTNSTQTDEILVPDIDSVSIELDTNSRDNVLL